MKTLLLNIPYKDKIVRRYMCSYNSPNFLFPPHELLGLGGIVKDWKNGEVQLLDAIAEGLDLEKCCEKISSYNPDIIVSLVGLECIQSDMDNLQRIKKRFPKAKVFCFGYYPTIFPKEILERVDIDAIFLNEPELAFSEVYDCIKSGKKIDAIDGIAFKANGTVTVSRASERIKDLDKLPYPYHALIKKDLYGEPGIGSPFTTIQSSRGCPFSCNYCVTTYGHQLVYRSPDNVIGEIEEIMRLGIRKIRFLDDLFNAKKDRVVSICNMIIEKQLNIEWTSLSRVDTLEGDVLKLMKRAGCKRIYVGVESGSQKILDYYHKGYKASSIREKIKLIKRAGMEVVGFFLVGAPVEGKEELEESIELANSTNFDYIIVTKLTPYPGTPLFDQMKDKMDFSLFPYRNRFKDEAWESEIVKREKIFYAAFYIRIGYVISKFLDFLRHPLIFISDVFKFLSFLLSDNSKRKDHGDYL